MGVPIDSVFHGFVWLINVQSDLNNGLFLCVFFLRSWLNLCGFFVFFGKSLILWHKTTFFMIRAFLVLGF